MLNTTSVAEIIVPVPPVAEQQRIGAEVDRRLSVVEELEAAVNANLQRATRLPSVYFAECIWWKLDESVNEARFVLCE